MDAHVDAMVKALVAVAWSDGRMDNEERDVLDALVSAFQLSADDTKAVRAYAASARTMEEVDVSNLSEDERRQLLQHAVILTYVDGEQSDREHDVIGELVKTLSIPGEEAETIIAAAAKRAQRLVALR